MMQTNSTKDNIEYQQGNLLDVKEGIIVHGCNAQGKMGSGVALALKNKYPRVYTAYLSEYNQGRVRLGYVVWDIVDDLTIASAITQEKYGRDNIRYVNYAAIAKCFLEVFGYAKTMNDVVYFPKIGAGLANGDWNIIQQIINDCDPENEVKKVCVTL